MGKVTHLLIIILRDRRKIIVGGSPNHKMSPDILVGMNLTAQCIF